MELFKKNIWMTVCALAGLSSGLWAQTPDTKLMKADEVLPPNAHIDISVRGSNSTPGFLFVDGGEDIVLGCDYEPGEDCFNLTASYQATFETDTQIYVVEEIPFDPPFPFEGLSNSLNPNVDDQWSPMDQLPFDFCFFGDLEQNFWVGSNGVITFQQPASNYNAWAFSQDLPNNTQQALYEANVFTPGHDINPATSTDEEIAYEVLGEYPNRVLVVSYFNVPMFSCSAERATHMAVFYEFSNIIDIYIESKPLCVSWQNSNAALGIQNHAGTIAYVPPGRNTSDSPWETYEEAWRFRPMGDPTYEFAWVDADGNFISDELTITVCPDEATHYTAQVTYTNTCNDDVVVIEDDVDFIFGNSIEVDLGEDKIFCDEFEHTLVGTPQNVQDLGNIEYAWYKDGILLPNHTLSTMVVTEPGAYTVKVSKTEIDCSEMDTMLIERIDFDLTLGDDIDDCDAENYELFADVSASGGIDPSDLVYEWNTGATTPGITATETGTYWVDVTYQGCTKREEVHVRVADTPEVSFAEDIIHKCPNEPILLSAIVTTEYPVNLTYSWQLDGTDIEGDGPEILVDSFGDYTLRVDNDGCEGVGMVRVEEYPTNSNCVITQGISPGGSAGKNDELDLTFLANRTGIAKLQIFNRYGQLVYEKKDYINEWVGQSKDGSELPTGTYYYIINLQGEDPVYGAQPNGWIYVNRGS